MRSFTFKTGRYKLDSAATSVVWRRFSRYTRPHRTVLLGAFAAALGVIAAQLASPWPIKVIFDHVLASPSKMSESWIAHALSYVADSPGAILAWVCGAILVFASLDALCCFLRDVLLAQTGQKVVGKIRQDLFGHLQKLPPPARTPSCCAPARNMPPWSRRARTMVRSLRCRGAPHVEADLQSAR